MLHDKLVKEWQICHAQDKENISEFYNANTRAGMP